MTNRQPTFLIALNVLIEVVPPVGGEPDETAEELARRLEEAIIGILGDQPPHLGWQSTRVLRVDDPRLNSGQCAVCGIWVTDLEAPEPVGGLVNGARIDDRLLCDEHLPAGHRWAF